MGKVIKRKNPGVGVDFRRVKHKVGRKLQKAQNDTDTTIRAQKIHVAAQSIAADKSGLHVTSRNLTLKELLSQLSHHSEKTRRDAVSGLTELLGRHPAELSANAGLVVERCLARISDKDGDVRKELAALVDACVLPGLTDAALSAFLPTAAAHVLSAMTALDAGVRAAAAHIMQLLAARLPGLVRRHFLVPCLDYLSVQLEGSHRLKSIKSRSVASLLRTLQGVEGFLSAVSGDLNRDVAGSPTADSQQSVPESREGEPSSSAPVLMRRRLAWSVPPSTKGVLRKATSRVQGAASNGHAPEAAAGLTRLLALLSTVWAECAGAYRDAADAQVASCLRLIAQSMAQAMVILTWAVGSREAAAMATHVQGPAGAGEASESGGAAAASLKAGLPGKAARERPRSAPVAVAATVAAAVGPTFPLRAPDSGLTEEARVDVALANRALSAVALKLAPAGRSEGAAVAAWVAGAVEFALGALAGTAPGSEEQGADKEEQRASADDAMVILPDLLAALPWLDPNDQVLLMQALCGAAAAAPPKSKLHVGCTRVVLHLCRTQPSAALGDRGAALAALLGALPRVAWTQGADRPAATHAALALIHVAASTLTRTPLHADDPLGAALLALRTELSPLLFVSLPSKKAGQPRRRFPGPLAKLPEATQRLAASTMALLHPLPTSTLEAMALAASSSQYPPSVRVQLVACLLPTASTCQPVTVSPECVAATVGVLRNAVREGERGGSAAVASAALASLCRAVGAAVAMELLLDALAGLCSDGGGDMEALREPSRLVEAVGGSGAAAAALAARLVADAVEAGACIAGAPGGTAASAGAVLAAAVAATARAGAGRPAVAATVHLAADCCGQFSALTGPCLGGLVSALEVQGRPGNGQPDASRVAVAEVAVDLVDRFARHAGTVEAMLVYSVRRKWEALLEKAKELGGAGVAARAAQVAATLA